MLLFCLLAFSACKGSEDAFGNLESSTETAPSAPEPAAEDEDSTDDTDDSDDSSDDVVEAPEIESFTPSDNPVVVIGSETKTFVVQVNSEAGSNVSYVWKLDGTTVQSSSSSFYNLNSSGISAGVHTLVVTASNPVGSDSQTFNIRKNSAPSVTSIDPAAAGNSVNCGDELDLEITAADADSDSLSFAWQLDGSSAPSMFDVTTTGNTSEATFTPTCAVSGAVVVSAVISDGNESTTQNWSVTVVNSNVAEITAYSPVASPVTISSSGSQVFSITASGKAPLSYSWELNGSDVADEDDSFITINGADLSTGSHTLIATVEDSDSSDTHTFSLIKNEPPVISATSPASTFAINFQTDLTISATVNDANSDALTFTWTMNGGASALLTNQTDTANSTQVTLDANATILGSNTIQLSASDGTDSSNYSWTISVNKLSDACNNLESGEICTIVGQAGMGNGLNHTTAIDDIRILPYDVVNDGNNNLFVSDIHHDVVWFVNRSGSAIGNVLGKSVAADTAVIVAGKGAPGSTSDGVAATSTYLNNPYGIAWDDTNNELFIASYSSNQVLYVKSDGTIHPLLSGSTSAAIAFHAEDQATSSAACHAPWGMDYDEDGERLYVACYNNHAIKYIDTSDSDHGNWTMSVLVGRHNGSNIVHGSADTNAGFTTTSAASYYPYDVKVGSDGNVYFTDRCRLRVVNMDDDGSADTLMGTSVTEGHVDTLSGVYNSCTTATARSIASTRFHYPYAIELYENGATVDGVFISSGPHHRILFLNDTGDDADFGGNTIVDGESNDITFTSGGASPDGDVANVTRFFNPMGFSLSTSQNDLYVSDHSNFRIRGIDLSEEDGVVSRVFGNIAPYGSARDSDMAANDARLYNPMTLSFDSDNNQLVIADRSNERLRALNTSTGVFTTILGDGSNNQSGTNIDPGVIDGRISGVAVVDGNIYMLNNAWCTVSIFNRSGSTSVFNGISTLHNKVSDLAGNASCTWWNDASYDGGAATSAVFHSSGGLGSNVAVDDTGNLYFSGYHEHCIYKVDTSGDITEYIGDCFGNGDGSGQGFTDGVATGASIRLRYPTQVLVDPSYSSSGNLFIMDQTNQAIGRIRYANFSGSTVVVAGESIANGQIATIANTGQHAYGLTTFSNQICYTSGSASAGDQTVTCIERDSAFGATSIRIGMTGGGQALGSEEEGIAASSASLYGPMGLAFDDDGNLYIGEYYGNKIRKVKRWFD